MGQANAARDKLYDLRMCDLSGKDASGFDLSGVIMTDTNLSKTNFKEAQFSKAYLHGEFPPLPPSDAHAPTQIVISMGRILPMG